MSRTSGAAALAVAAVIVLAGCGGGGSDGDGAGVVPTGPRRAEVPFEQFNEVGLEIVAASGDRRRACMLLAETPEQRARGLMEVRDLGRYAGMVFRFEALTETSFYMRNTPMPLSIAFVDDGGRFVSQADMAPCGDGGGCPLYPPAGPFLLAVEVPRGRLGELGIGPGATVSAAGPC